MVGYRKDAKVMEHPRKEAFVRNGCSYSAALTNNAEGPSGLDGQEVKFEKTVDVHGETSAFFDLHGRTVVGRVNKLGKLINMKVFLRSAVFCAFKLHYLGGLNLMIVFEDESDASEFILNMNLWKEWFETMDVWSGQTLAYERIAWLKFYGVPLHLAENKVFNDVASLYGKVVKGSHLCTEDWDLSSSCVGVLVDAGTSIVGSATLVWKKKKFRIWIKEEQEDWVPDCMFEDVWPSSFSAHNSESKTDEQGKDLLEKVNGTEEEDDQGDEEDSSDEEYVCSVDLKEERAVNFGVQRKKTPEVHSPVRDNVQSGTFNVGGVHDYDNIGNLIRNVMDENSNMVGESNSLGGAQGIFSKKDSTKENSFFFLLDLKVIQVGPLVPLEDKGPKLIK
ncbi:hypothetical protein Hdeb2414_s0157g00817101 [Helianthus debilis subsp. tardiflorus]